MSIDYSKGRLLTLSTIHNFSAECLGDILTMMGASFLTAASAAWPSANRAVYIPFMIGAPVTIAQMFIHNGATVSGNIDIGIFEESGRRLVNSGATAQSGTSVLQLFNIADTLLHPGRYYMAISIDNATATLLGHTIAGTAQKAFGVLEQASAFSLPTLATFAASTQSFVPLVGMALKSTL